jgi:hypothetical protein
MTLRIYDAALPTSYFSQDGLFSNPVLFSFDGRSGGSSEQLLYVRNSDATYEYSDIVVFPDQLEGDIDLVEGTRGFAFRLKAGTSRPTTEEWLTIAAGEEIDIAAITDTVTYMPFWLRVECPRQVPVQRFKGIVLKIQATQTLA